MITICAEKHVGARSIVGLLSVAMALAGMGCEAKSETTGAPLGEPAMATPSVSARPALPPEPAPPVADRAAEVPNLEAKLAADKAYAAVGTGPRADLNAFLSYVSEMLARGGVTAPLGAKLKTKKLHDAGIKLFMVFARVGHYSDDFTKKLAAHLEATKSEPHAGTWSAFAKWGALHDYTALAAWSRLEDAIYLREVLSGKPSGAGPFPWSSWTETEPPPRPWLVDESLALERLALVTTLSPAEESCRAALTTVAKKDDEKPKSMKLAKGDAVKDFERVGDEAGASSLRLARRLRRR